MQADPAAANSPSTGDRMMILAPIVRGRKGEYRQELEKLARDGFVRARIDGELCPLDDPPRLDKRKNHTIEVVVDRLLVKPGIAARLAQSIATALKLAKGLVTVSVVGGDRAGFFREDGLQRMRHFRAAARAALVQLQFAVRRLPRVQRPGLEIRFRSGESDCRIGRGRCSRAASGPARVRRS